MECLGEGRFKPPPYDLLSRREKSVWGLKIYPKCKKPCEQLTKDLQKVDNPELKDNGPTTAPSKRIIKAIEESKKYKYNKPTTGKSVTKEIGIDKLRAKYKIVYVRQRITKNDLRILQK